MGVCVSPGSVPDVTRWSQEMSAKREHVRSLYNHRPVNFGRAPIALKVQLSVVCKIYLSDLIFKRERERIRKLYFTSEV